MARFTYLGEPARPTMVVTMGPSLEFRIPMKDGTKDILIPVPPATEFVIDEDIGYDITDERSLRYLRSDVRFEEIV